jgi:hypothetical protein
LSALDKTAWPFPLEALLAELEQMHARGVRVFKFVDRTFNLHIATSKRILQFFLDKLAADPANPVFAHFELVPDHLPESLKESVKLFPEGTLQFEIGIQTFNVEVQCLISRKQNNEKAMENLRWLRTHSNAHLHVDLIAGLPGEDVASFARGFDQLVSLQPHEIQMGILKRLRGAPISRHTKNYELVFDPAPPYTILSTNLIAFTMMQRLLRFARYWDLVANSGRFKSLLPELLAETPFARFLALSDWLYAKTDATHRISPERLAGLLNEWLLLNGAESLCEPALVSTVTASTTAALSSPLATQRQQRHQAALPSRDERQASIKANAASLNDDKGNTRARSKIINA